MRYLLETGLGAGNNQTAECGALNSSADSRCSVLETPGECGVEIGSRLNSRRWQRRFANDRRQGERQGQMWRKAVAYKFTNGSLCAKAGTTAKHALIETPFAL